MASNPILWELSNERLLENGFHEVIIVAEVTERMETIGFGEWSPHALKMK